MACLEGLVIYGKEHQAAGTLNVSCTILMSYQRRIFPGFLEDFVSRHLVSI